MKKLLFLVTVSLSLNVNAQPDQSRDSLDLMIGQMIMIGIGDFNKADLNQPIFTEIGEGKVGGVVLYEKNIDPKNPRPALAQLVTKLQKNAKIQLFISIDEEGGRVRRLKEKYGFERNVSAAYIGRLNDLDSTRFYANRTVSILDSLGINMNYAPVVDVNINPRNPIIGKMERSYSDVHQHVTRHARHVIEIHNKKGIVPVLKHFPGHGSSMDDTHLGIADVTETWQFEELFPYRSLIDSGVVNAIMTAHIVNKTLDSSKTPATLSRQVVTGILREFMGYRGVIISDDMQMGAIKNEYGLREAVRRSIEAGVDLLMFANNVKDYDMVTASTVHQLIKDLVLEGIISQERISESYDRIIKLKNDFGLMDVGYFKMLKARLKADN